MICLKIKDEIPFPSLNETKKFKIRKLLRIHLREFKQSRKVITMEVCQRENASWAKLSRSWGLKLEFWTEVRN